MVKLYAIEPVRQAHAAIQDISVLEQRDERGDGYFQFHRPAQLPVLGLEALLEIDLPIPYEMLYQLGEAMPEDATYRYFRIPSHLMGDAKARLLGYEELIKLADETLDSYMRPSGGTVGSRLERQIAENYFEQRDALLLVALERRKRA